MLNFERLVLVPDFLLVDFRLGALLAFLQFLLGLAHVGFELVVGTLVVLVLLAQLGHALFRICCTLLSFI